MVHLLLHLPREVILGGPVYMQWKYPFERFIKKLNEYFRSRAHIEGSIVETYVDASIEGQKKQLDVFNSQCRPIDKQSFIQLDHKTHKMVEWYILNNSLDIQIGLD